jgi:uncharacterized membrane protein
MSFQLEAENQAGTSVALSKVCPLHKGMAIACCCAAIASLTPVALMQLRIIERLPDLPGRIFNSKQIVTSKKAYHFGIPDGVLGLGSYGLTLILLIAAKPSQPLLQTALRGKLLLDGAIAARKTRGHLKEFGSICSWCISAAIATAGVVYFARKAREAERLHRA